jgi:hypothetical protein
MTCLTDEALKAIIKDALTAARTARLKVGEQVNEIFDALDDAHAFDLSAPDAVAGRERIAPDVVVERNGNGSILAIEIAE